MAYQLHSDCHTGTEFSVFYDTVQCSTLVVGYSRAECKRYMIASIVHGLISDYVDSIKISFAANHETVFSHFIEASDQAVQWCQTGNWYIALASEPEMLQNVPFQVTDISSRSYGKRDRDLVTSMTIWSPFAKKQKQHFTSDSPLIVHAATVRRRRYLVSHLQGDELVCLDGDYRQLHWRLSSDADAERGKLYQRVRHMISECEQAKADLYAVVLEAGTEIRKSQFKDFKDTSHAILRMVVDVERAAPCFADQANKSQVNKPGTQVSY